MVFEIKGMLSRSGRNICLVATLVFTVLALTALIWSLAGKDIEDGVYRIVVSSSDSLGHGSGFKVAEPGILVTNHHVIEGAERIQVAFMEKGQTRSVDARILWYNSDKDLAILRTNQPLPGKSVELAGIGIDELSKTESVRAVGFPGIADRVARGLERGVFDQATRDQTLLDPTVSSGTIQRLVPTVQRLTIQHSANINGGNSGGPLFDACNRVVGVNTLGTRSTVGARDIYNALVNAGQVTVNDPGDLEFAVHVREVLLGLSEKEIPVSVTPGRCRGGLDVYELTTIGSSMALALMSVLFAGFYWRKQSAAPENGELTGHMETHLHPAERPLTSSAAGICLYDVAGDLTHSLARFDAELRGPGVLLGRTGGDAAIVIDDPSVSRRHARIRYHGDDLVVHDDGSTNGTRVDGSAVTRTQGQFLRPGSVLHLGNAEFSVKRGQDNRSGGDVAAGMRTWMLSGFDLRGTTIQHTIAEAGPAQNSDLNVVCTIGRSADSDIVIDDDSVSRRHAQIGMDRHGELSIIDLGSSNGTFVDKKQVGSAPVQIRNAKILSFGRTELRISSRS